MEHSSQLIMSVDHPKYNGVYITLPKPLTTASPPPLYSKKKTSSLTVTPLPQSEFGLQTDVNSGDLQTKNNDE